MSFCPSKFKAIHHVQLVSHIVKSHSKFFKWPKLPNVKMIDIGTGPGEILMSIESQLPKNYVEIMAVDKSKDMVNYFKSIPKDSRISCRLLDIETTKLPHDLKYRFDFAFSSYCFTYVKNFRQAFQNTRDLLKPDGEILCFWCKNAHLYEIYRTLNQTKKWAPYTDDFKDWKPHFDNDDPIGTLEDELNRVNLKILKTEMMDDLVFEAKELKYFLDIYDSLDFVSNRIPKSDLSKYKEEFVKLALTRLHVDDDAEEHKKVKYLFPTIIFSARKV